jgi:hypothetical protein
VCGLYGEPAGVDNVRGLPRALRHRSPAPVDGISDVAQLVDLLTGEDVEPSNSTLSLELDGFGYRWFRIAQA